MIDSNKKNTLLRDPLMADALQKLGFCKTTLGDSALTEALRKLYNDTYSVSNEKDMYVTHNAPDSTLAYHTHEKIKEIVQPFLDKELKDHKIFASHFVIKTAQGKDSFQLHQDWNIVNENQYESFQVWIPLDVSYPENGGMGFVPGSHQFFPNLRSGSFDIPRVPLEPILYRHLSYLRLIPGEAAVFYNSTFHCSFTNSSPEDRVAVLINIVDKNAPTIYQHKRDDHVDTYAVNTDTFLEHLHVLEKGRCEFADAPLESFPYEQEDNTTIDVNRLIEKIREYAHHHDHVSDYEHKMFHVLRNPEIEKEINHFGYTIIRLLGEAELATLKEGFLKYFPNRSQYVGRYSSMDNFPGDTRREIHQYIQNCIKDRLELFFENYKCPISLLYSKRADGADDVDWHSDPSLIFNEHIEPMYGIWCPLVDVNKHNGTLMVVPGSHRLFNKLHGSYKVLSWPLSNRRHLLTPFGIDVDLKAGEAIVYDSRMVHSSSPNFSDQERDCIMMRINHERSEYFNQIISPDDPGKAILYHQTNDYFFGNTVSRHSEIPNTGTKQGHCYLFDMEVSDMEVSTLLERYRSKMYQDQ